MAGTHTGGKQAGRTNRQNYDKAYLQMYGMTFYQYLGHLGGSKSRTGGFYANRELAREAGRKGGLISKRTKKKA